MSNIKLVYVVETVFSERDYKRFFVNELRLRGFDILILALTKVFYDKVYDKVVDKNQKKSEDIVECSSLSDFYKAINSFHPDFCWNFISPGKKKYFTRLIVNSILRFKTTVIEFNIINLPLVAEKLGIKDSFKKAIKTIIYSPFLFCKPQYSYVTNFKTLETCVGKPLKIHEFDYDLYLEAVNKKEPNTGKPYLLFLDEDCVFHSDFIYRNIINPCTEDVYFKEVNTALKELSEKLNLNLVIQLHPRAQIERSGKFYEGDISNKPTAEAIRDASFVVAHASTAIQLAVLFKKPILLLETSEYKQLKVSYQLLLNFQQILRCTAISPDTASLINKIPSVDQEAYGLYEKKYIKITGTPRKFSYEIFSELLTDIVHTKRKRK